MPALIAIVAPSHKEFMQFYACLPPIVSSYFYEVTREEDIYGMEFSSFEVLNARATSRDLILAVKARVK